jgi:hypothetical protein
MIPEGDVLVHAGDFMNSGYDPADICSFNGWLAEQSFESRIVLQLYLLATVDEGQGPGPEGPVNSGFFLGLKPQAPSAIRDLQL